VFEREAAVVKKTATGQLSRRGVLTLAQTIVAQMCSNIAG
jgi:hypothetical protein